MKKAKLQQIGLALCLIVSLLASTVFACTCSSHTSRTIETVEVSNSDSSCHGHSQQKETASSESISHEEQNDFDQRASDAARSFVPAAQCCCAESVPKTLAKAENLKIEKQILTTSAYAPAATTFVARIISVESEFITPFYLTDSFYNLTPGRAPPVL